MKAKATLIRAGDFVRITAPQRFIRCGYPLTQDDMLREIEENADARAAFDLLAETLGIAQRWHRFEPVKVTTHEDKIKRELAYAMLKSRGFGGRQRRMHFADCPELLGKEVRVSEVFTVVTGDYYPPGGCLDDYEPGGLSGQRPHRIAKVSSWHLLQSKNDPLMFPLTHLEPIEASRQEAA